MEPNSWEFFTEKRSSLRSLLMISSHRLMLRSMWFTCALYPNTRSMHALILPVPSTFSTQGLKAPYFSRLKKYQPSAGKKGSIVGTMAFSAQTHCSIGLDPLFNRPGAHSSPLPDPPHEAAQGGPRRPTVLKPHGNPPDDAVLEPVRGPETPQLAISPHIGKLLRENTQSRYLSLNFLISKSFIWKNNP